MFSGCLVGHPRVPQTPLIILSVLCTVSPLPHHTVYVVTKREEDEPAKPKKNDKPKKAEDVSALAVALYDSVKLLPWYTTVVLGMQPLPVPVEPAVVADDAIPVVPAAIGFDEVKAARAVYGSYFSGDALEQKNWTETKVEGARSVSSEYNKMNVHYYIQKGRQSPRMAVTAHTYHPVSPPLLMLAWNSPHCCHVRDRHEYSKCLQCVRNPVP